MEAIMMKPCTLRYYFQEKEKPIRMHMGFFGGRKKLQG
jgi:hypothetical protein